MLQIQPVQSAWAQWTALAQKEGLSYEVLEFSMPPLLGGEQEVLAPIEERYRQSSRVRSIHGAFIDVNPGSSDSAFRALSCQRCRESCRLAKRLGAGHVVFHVGAEPFLRGMYTQGWVQTTAAFFSELAEEFDLGFFLENSQDADPEPMLRVLEQTGNTMKACLDFGHVNYSRTPLTEWFDALKDHIGYVHLSDNLGRFDDHLPLGAGTVDWALADRLWRSLGKDTPVTLEVGGPEGVRQSLEYLRQHHYFGMEGSV